eukprot:2650665-Amphidinium_carterae.1
MLLDCSSHRALWRRLAVACSHRSLVVQKIKAHSARPERFELGWRWAGNQHADAEAKRVVECHSR